MRCSGEYLVVHNDGALDTGDHKWLRSLGLVPTPLKDVINSVMNAPRFNNKGSAGIKSNN